MHLNWLFVALVSFQLASFYVLFLDVLVITFVSEDLLFKSESNLAEVSALWPVKIINLFRTIGLKSTVVESSQNRWCALLNESSELVQTTQTVKNRENW